MSPASFLKRLEEAVPHAISTMISHRLDVSRGSGALLWDSAGKEYLDFSGGVGAGNVGHAHPKVVAAVSAQNQLFSHTCFAVTSYDPYVRVAEKLNQLAPVEGPARTLLVNSGAEANENAVKISRYATGRQAILVFTHSFHGRTQLAMTMTAKTEPYKRGFGPFAPEVYRAEYPYCYRCPFGKKRETCSLECAQKVREVVKTQIGEEQLAAIVIEPVAGEGGFIPAPPEFLREIQALCKETGAVFVDDEVQTGIARTGTMFVADRYGLEPDLVVTGKSLGAGYPLAGVTGRAEIMDAPHTAGLGTTFGGNPVSCAAALAVFEVVESERLADRANTIGERVGAALEQLVGEVRAAGDARGLGAMRGLELVADRETKEPAADVARAVQARCLEQGLLILICGTYSNVVRMLMPLVISDDQLDRGLEIFSRAVRESGD